MRNLPLHETVTEHIELEFELLWCISQLWLQRLEFRLRPYVKLTTCIVSSFFHDRQYHIVPVFSCGSDEYPKNYFSAIRIGIRWRPTRVYRQLWFASASRVYRLVCEILWLWWKSLWEQKHVNKPSSKLFKNILLSKDYVTLRLVLLFYNDPWFRGTFEQMFLRQLCISSRILQPLESLAWVPRQEKSERGFTNYTL